MKMTQRENDIFRIIQADPMISQNEIADKLGITRSAVSAYLVAMTKKGVIKGRGYILNPEGFVLVIGPGHIDIITSCSDKGLRAGMHDSLQTTITYGGATKNLAQYLVRLGVKVKGLFTVTSDSFGKNFLADCRKNNIECDDSLVLNDQAMPIYNEISKENGEVIASATVIDTLAEYISPNYLTSKAAVLRAADKIVVHDSVSYAALAYISSTYESSRLVYFSTYPSLTLQHTDLLRRFGTIIMSYSTAYSLCFGREPVPQYKPSASEVQELCVHVRKLGLTCVVIPYSLTGSCIINDNHGMIMETDYKISHSCARDSYRFYRDASMASIINSQLDLASDYDLLVHLAATKLIVSSSVRLADNNYCEALVQSVVAGSSVSTICFEL